MKYYKNISINYFTKLFNLGIHFLEQDYSTGDLRFVKNKSRFNLKNAALIRKNNFYYFFNNKFIGDQNNFKSKKEWRKYIKLLMFI